MQERTRHIAVVGAGAVGCYFGGLLARAGAQVTLIGHSPHVEAIRQNGLLLQTLGREDRIAAAATEDIAAVQHADLVLFCVKSPDTDAAAAAMAPHLAANAAVLSLQNGVDNVARIRRQVNTIVIPALVYAAVFMAAPGCVKHTGGGRLVIGLLPEDGEKVRGGQRLLVDIVALFARAGVPVKVSDNIKADLWTKLAMNCAYNAISALGGARYSQMVAMPEVRDLMRAAAQEVMQVARAKGIQLPDSVLDETLRLADSMPETISSTAQDIRKGRRTEIDHLNGYVARAGEALGVPTPVNRTLATLVKLLEQSPRA
jgi:2-dehydropantoate 2-reductase